MLTSVNSCKTEVISDLVCIMHGGINQSSLRSHRMELKRLKKTPHMQFDNV